MRARHLLPVLTATVLSAGSLTAVAPVARAGSGPALPTVVSGTLLSAAGQPAQGRVELFAWPETADLEVGESVELIPVAAGVADAVGRFRLGAAPSAPMLSMARGLGGFVNLELRSTSGERVSTTHFSRSLDTEVQPFAADGSVLAWGARPGENAEPIEVRLPAEPNLPRSEAVVPMVSSRCGPYELQEKRGADTIIGELRSEEDTVVGHFAYGGRADSEVSVGMRLGGRGAWSVSGEHHVGNDHGTAVDGDVKPRSGDDVILRSSFDYGRFARTCYDIHEEQIRNMGWQGHGLDVQPTVDRGCSFVDKRFQSEYGPGGGFTRDDKRAAAWGGAAEVFGFSFQARSGYSRWVKSRWKFGDEADHVICGNDGKVTESSLIFAGWSAPAADPCRPGKPC